MQVGIFAEQRYNCEVIDLLYTKNLSMISKVILPFNYLCLN